MSRTGQALKRLIHPQSRTSDNACGNADDGAVGRNVFYDNRIRTHFGIVTHGNVSQHLGAGIYGTLSQSWVRRSSWYNRC